MQWLDHHDWTDRNGNDRNPGAWTRAVLLNASLTFALLFYLATLFPRELVLATLSAMLLIAATVTAARALLTRVPMWSPHLSDCDVAAMFVLLSIGLSWLVDPESVRAFLETKSAAATAS